MTTAKLVGLLLLICAGLDILVAQFLVGPRIQDPEKSKLMKTAICSGAALMGLLGLAFFYGFIPLGR